MLNRLKGAFDPYILLLLGTVALASLVPARGGFAAAAGGAAGGEHDVAGQVLILGP